MAIGKPVALEASAEKRDTRGFISMTTTRPVRVDAELHVRATGIDADLAQRTAMEASRRRWYSLSVRVCAGATAIESPVCTPIGSRFSIEQTMMQLSAVADHFHLELLQPSTDSSTSTSVVGDSSRPRLTISTSSSRL